jgi:hypothetical protein
MLHFRTSRKYIQLSNICGSELQYTESSAGLLDRTEVDTAYTAETCVDGCIGYMSHKVVLPEA